MRKTPHGVDLGPLEPRLPERLATKDRRIELVPKVYEADLARLDASLKAAVDGSLVLIGRRQLRSNNSWMHNSPRLVKGPPACTLLMHPHDASERSLTSGQLVVVRSRTGAVRATVVVTEEIAKGVISLPHGFGHNREGVTMETAVAHAGVSLNDLTDELRIDALSGTAAFSGTPVTVEGVGRSSAHV